MDKCKKAREMYYDRWPTAVDRELQQQYGAWFRTIAWTWYLTLTFDREVTSNSAWALLEEYLLALEKRFKQPLSALIVMENRVSGLGKPGGGVHFHILLKCGPDVERKVMKENWEMMPYGGERCGTHPKLSTCHCGQCQEGAARVCPYDSAISGTYYMFKDAYRFTDNWDLRRSHYLGGRKCRSFATSAEVRESIMRQENRQRLLRATSMAPSNRPQAIHEPKSVGVAQ